MSKTDPLAVRFFIIVLFFSGVAGETEKRAADCPNSDIQQLGQNNAHVTWARLRRE